VEAYLEPEDIPCYASAELISSVCVEYNSRGQPVSYTDHQGRTKKFERDAFGRVIKEFSPDYSVEYSYDAVGSRTGMAKTGTAFSQADSIAYVYNSRRELTGASAQNDQTYSYGYNYDNIGNRVDATESGLSKAYTSNNLNQYTSVTNPAQSPAYDADGNMISDGTGWTFTWDAENRLKSAVNGTRTIEFKYDYLSRRIEKKVTDSGSVTKLERYVYDGWNMIEKLNGSDNNVIIGKNIWGLDLNGTLQTPGRNQSSGGIGALLSMLDSGGVAYYYLYDANGNVGQILDGGGTVASKYEYAPFGGLSLCTEAVPNDFRFSTKFFDTETGLVYYGHRYYSPSLGRWFSKDPIEEEGGWNLYCMVRNNVIFNVDNLGLFSFTSKGFGGALLGLIGGYLVLQPTMPLPGRLAGIGLMGIGAMMVLSDMTETDVEDPAKGLAEKMPREKDLKDSKDTQKVDEIENEVKSKKCPCAGAGRW